jgi:superfamily II DNA or RNA helicase
VKPPADILVEISRIEDRLGELDVERGRLATRLDELRRSLAGAATAPVSPPQAAGPKTPEDKIALFRALFRGRTDVFPRRWENSRTHKSGYSPVCGNEWKRGVCEKPRVKCGECPHRDFVPVTDQVILDHLQGRHVAGLYLLLPDETTHLLAIDFDGGGWREDVRAFGATCRALGFPTCVERSRSGNGAHAWFFFEGPVSAATARAFGSYLLTETMSRHPVLGMDSYDRLFPNQDTMPRGGFGNLIALPLQREARGRGHSVFLGEDLEPVQDQWGYLAAVRRVSTAAVERVVREAQRQGRVLGVRFAALEEDEQPWSLPPSRARPPTVVTGTLPGIVRVVEAQRLFVDRSGMPAGLVAELRRLAAFQNPVFYQKQAMRFSTAGTPRVVSCAEETDRHVALPRGCRDDLFASLSGYGIQIDLVDERVRGRPIDAPFRGELTAVQHEAAKALLAHDTGVLVAPPGTGKTVLGAHAIAERRVNTLVLVHRRPLLEQWVERLSSFLGLDPKAIGVVGAGKQRRTGEIDVAMVQSLVRKGVVQDLVAEYGQVIVDECHHVSAATFERVLSEVKARYVLGLTATPRRRDGHHPIAEMQLGPVRFTVAARELAAARGFDHQLIVRNTGFATDWSREIGIQELYARIAADGGRNELIVNDVLEALEARRSPLLLTERRDHVELLAAALRPATRHLVVLHGGMRSRERKAAMEQLAEIPPNEERLVIATGRFIGEGFDDPRLDTLVLAMPVAWRGTLVQYAGRLHREHHGKREVRVYDYVDSSVPVLARMFEKRLRGYRAIGYVRRELSPAEAPKELTVEYDRS